MEFYCETIREELLTLSVEHMPTFMAYLECHTTK
jgi:hypothetical protein